MLSDADVRKLGTNFRVVPRELSPFASDRTARDETGALRYTDLPKSLVDVLAGHAADRPDREALVEVGGDRLTYRELWERAARVAGGLRANGVRRGDRVAVRYPAGVQWVIAFWGILIAGAVVVPVNTRFTTRETRAILDDAGVEVDLAPGVALPDGDPIAPERADADVAALFYTSGTTGSPKGVPTTHEAFLANAENMTRCADLPRSHAEQLRTLISIPLFHVTGCNAQLLTVAYLGGTAIIMQAFEKAVMLRTLVEEHISFLVTVPAAYALLLRESAFRADAIPALRWIGYGGAPITTTVVRALQDAFPSGEVFNGYGMTETASLITMLPNSDAAEHADSVGYAVPTIDLALDETLGPEGSGELLVRGQNVTAGYWGGAARSDGDRWFRTGDIVTIDENGLVRLVDRAKDVINRGGENISSLEVENVLLTTPGVLDAAVVGVPDEVMGEKVGAVVVTADPGLDLAAIIDHASTALADYKVPQYLELRSEPLPRNPGGKVLKSELRRTAMWVVAPR